MPCIRPYFSYDCVCSLSLGLSSCCPPCYCLPAFLFLFFRLSVALLFLFVDRQLSALFKFTCICLSLARCIPEANFPVSIGLQPTVFLYPILLHLSLFYSPSLLTQISRIYLFPVHLRPSLRSFCFAHCLPFLTSPHSIFLSLIAF